MPEVKKASQRQARASSDIHIDERFLYEHLRDTRAEMSWRRELEFRLMQFILVFFPVIGTVIIELFRANINVWAFFATAVGAIALILTATIMITKRIKREHEVYVELSQQLLMVWSYFGLFEHGAYLKDKAFLSKKLFDEKNGIGKGPGYQRTQQLIWITSSAVMGILIILAVTRIIINYR
jgi:hypothetical protein